jgi:flavin-dependent dehydrogenase
VVAPRRHALDTLMVNAAMSAGATLSTGVTIEGVRRAGEGRVIGVYGHDADGPIEISARFVVGADGLRSRIARAVDAPFTEVRGNAGATHYAYYAGDWPKMEYFLGDRAFAGVFPTNNGEACIWVCTPAEDALQVRRAHDAVEDSFAKLLRTGAPELADRLQTSAMRTSPVRGMIGLPNHLRHPVGSGWALVGDAGYHRDPITGHGITDAFRDADLLATSLDLILGDGYDEATALAAFHADRDRQLRAIFEITNELVTYPAVPRFVELQRQLSSAMDTQAAVLSARPLRRLVAA